MALLTVGYWPTTYWPSNYWTQDYWPEYGIVSVRLSHQPELVVLIPPRDIYFVDQEEEVIFK